MLLRHVNSALRLSRHRWVRCWRAPLSEKGFEVVRRVPLVKIRLKLFRRVVGRRARRFALCWHRRVGRTCLALEIIPDIAHDARNTFIDVAIEISARSDDADERRQHLRANVCDSLGRFTRLSVENPLIGLESRQLMSVGRHRSS